MARKPIDWNNAPDWAEWYAIDEDGEGWFYANKPHIMYDPTAKIEVWWADGKFDESDENDDTADWQQSLTQRPVEKKLK